ncbi:histidinol-phosphatase (PHP family) [Paenibacillus sp. 1_12]|uniref:histidinol-phosphatase HisJ n=1 Tax=Paenibacillus sp. 1_12 TaxID=1566278 RepID=UPI0008E9C0F0|nr:histidinol-phosphatase HisJ [Paenibacillus sp. 1_12]SFM53499.1 histidinol-phosphatase (PHP family) [Paenibacillus sp. 1_12]
MLLKWDGHTHTKFCYHGSNVIQEMYIDRAIELGFERYTLSEHSPLPVGWIDDISLFKRLAMPIMELPLYIQYAKEIKLLYQGKLEITVGLELDYLPGQLSFTERIVEEWLGDLEDVIYSVHYLPGVDGIHCIDYTADNFRENILAFYGTMENVVNTYYDHVEAAITWVSHLPMRKRIGHINLIEKFANVLPEIEETQIRVRLEAIIPLLVKSNVGIDVNTAGLRMGTCGKPYVPEWFIVECRKHRIACIYGSDAHAPEHVGTGWDWFKKQHD